MFAWIRKWKAKREEALQFESAIIVVDADGCVTSKYPNGDVQSVRWDDLERVEVHTNDTGPWGADFWWVLTDGNGECSYPQGATGEAEMLPKLQALAGFDNNSLGEAVRCTSNQQFLCWDRARAT